MSPDIARLLWPPSRLGDALQALAAKTDEHLQTPSAIVDDREALGEWLEGAALWLGIETQRVETPYPDFERQVSRIGPALIRISSGFLAVCKSRSRSVVAVVAPDGNKHKVSTAALRSALCGEIEAPVTKQIQELLERAGVPAAKQAKAREAILKERFSARRISGIWLLRQPPGAN